MPKLPRQVTNRVISIKANNLTNLDEWTQELLDIIDSYGGSNPFPRFVTTEGYYFYSCTTKIPNQNLEEFDKDIKEFIDNDRPRD